MSELGTEKKVVQSLTSRHDHGRETKPSFRFDQNLTFHWLHNPLTEAWLVAIWFSQINGIEAMWGVPGQPGEITAGKMWQSGFRWYGPVLRSTVPHPYPDPLYRDTARIVNLDGV